MAPEFGELFTLAGRRRFGGGSKTEPGTLTVWRGRFGPVVELEVAPRAVEPLRSFLISAGQRLRCSMVESEEGHEFLDVRVTRRAGELTTEVRRELAELVERHDQAGRRAWTRDRREPISRRPG